MAQVAIKKLSWEEVEALVQLMSAQVPAGSRVWPIPRGGHCVAAMLQVARPDVAAVSEPEAATLAVDDLFDSGRTARRVQERYGLETVALLDKRTDPEPPWYVFPWEGSWEQDAADTVVRMLEQIGENPTRPELAGTPGRVVRGWAERYGGYQIPDHQLGDLLELRAAAPSDGRGMGLVEGIPFYSTCERHLLPFYGRAAAACLPDSDGWRIAPETLPRLVAALAGRLQTQERLTQQLCETLAGRCAGAAVQLRATHSCRIFRDPAAQDAVTETAAYAGAFQSNPELQREFARRLRGA